MGSSPPWGRTATDDDEGRDERDPAPLHRRAGRADRGRLAGPLGGGGHVPRAQPGRARGPSRRRSPAAARSSRPRHVPLPVAAPGLHVGHPLGYIATDVFAPLQPDARQERPARLGYDAFGLPAEQYAVQTGQHPRKTTEENIVTMKRQLRRLGLGHDDRRTHRDDRPRLLPLDAVDLPADLQLLVRRRRRARGRRQGAGPPDRRARRSSSRAGERPDARRARTGPTLSRDRAAPRSSTATGWPTPPRRRSTGARAGHGAGQRGGHQRGPLRARQLPGLQAQPAPVDDADHRLRRPAGRRPRPASTGPRRSSCMQRNWIGRSEGARVVLPRRWARTRRSRSSPPAPTRCSAPPSWCWRPSTRCVDEHCARTGTGPTGTKDVVDRRRGHPGGGRRGLPAARRRARATSSGRPRARTRPVCSPAPARPTRSTATQIPVFVADYVLMGYGTGAIMAVPGQDERDWEFADAFDLPIIRTVQPAEGHPDDERVHRRRRRRSTRANDEISPRRPGRRRGQGARSSTGCRPRASARAPSTTSCATGCSAASATGASRSRSSSTRTGIAHARARVDAAASTLPGRARLLAARPSTPTTRSSEPGAAAVARATSGSRSSWTWATAAGCGSTAARPTRCPTGPARAGTTCATSTRPTTRRFVDPANEAYWMGPHADAGRRRPGGHARPRRRRPLRRRRRARRAAPALRALLAQGAVRPGPR